MDVTTHANEMRATVYEITPAGQASGRVCSSLQLRSHGEVIYLIFPHVTADQLQALADEFNVIIAIGEAAAKDAGQ